MIRRLLRAAITGGLVLALLSSAAPAFAEDLEDYLAMAADADYAGTRVVVSVWGGESYAEVTRVEHSADAMMLWTGRGAAVIAQGRVSRAEGSGVAVAAWNAPSVTDKYTVGDAIDLKRLGRAARAVTVYEGDLVRARIVFDLATWAPLATEIFDGEGDLFRFASFTSFDPNPRQVYHAVGEGQDYELAAPIDHSPLPGVAGGYERVDAYTGADGVVQAFFTDGLFSFSVFEVTARQMEDRFDGAATFAAGDAEYLVIVRPSQTWVAWQRGEIAYVLVGDLPPDHLEAVLIDLPAPKSRSWFERLFGFFR